MEDDGGGDGGVREDGDVEMEMEMGEKMEEEEEKITYDFTWEL